MTTPFHEARIKALLSLSELCALTPGVSLRTLYRAENGEPIGDLNQERIARALGFKDRRELFPESEEASA